MPNSGVLPVNDMVISSADDLARQLEYLSSSHHLRVGEFLLQRGSITPEQLASAISRKLAAPQKRLGEILVEMGAVTDEEVGTALQCLMGIPRVSLKGFAFDLGAVGQVPELVARRLRIMPLMMHQDTLVVACAQVPDTACLQMLGFTTKRHIAVVLADGAEIDEAIAAHFDLVSESLSVSELVVEQTFNPADDNEAWADAETEAQQQPIVRLVNSLIRDAIQRRASDIHIRPGREGFQLLYRIDGSMIVVKQVKKRLLPAVVSRIKILSGLNIAERRLPQDGHMRVLESGSGSIDLRVSIIPMQHGESVVIRVLNKQQGLRDIRQIGFTQDDEEVFLDLINRSNGILLVTGPTGSGKTTTLYAALQEVKSDDINIITVEDPIEYELEGMRQIQLLEAIGFSFPQTLRHILRHDPDIIMIGEMRDQETCKIALEAALTGHLVFSTLHTNDAPSAIIRMQEMGMTPYLLKSALIGVVGQRLIRLNCPHCRVEEKVGNVIRRNAGVAADEFFWCGAGCEECHGTGFSGRAAIYEMFVINDYVRDRIHEHMSSGELMQIAVESGMRPLLQHGLEYARAGKASLTEVYRASM